MSASASTATSSAPTSWRECRGAEGCGALRAAARLGASARAAGCGAAASPARLARRSPLTVLLSRRGQVAFITGGGSGIGFRIAEIFMRWGSAVGLRVAAVPAGSPGSPAGQSGKSSASPEAAVVMRPGRVGV